LRIRLFTIDLDETLWPCTPVIRAAEQALHDWLREQAAELAAAHDIQSLRQHRQALTAWRPELAHDLTALRRTSLELLLQEFGYDPALAVPATEAFLEARNRVTPFPEVSSALQWLRPRFQLVSVTNGNADLERTPLRGFFHHSLTAAEVGAAKPDPALFYEALTLAETEPGQAVHVGDDPRLDVDAARQVGMRTVWMNRDAREWPEELAPPDYTVTELRELVDWLNGD
jgi:putative hydrolase of the HAD superfamily